LAFRIDKNTVSSKAWGDVDKTALRNRLVQGLENNESGVQAAIREVYAVIKSSDLTDTPSATWWGPHHEVQDDGTVVLNREGLGAAAAALAGARANPDLTAEQKREAARHLIRHYRDLNETPPDSLLQLAGQSASGEMVRLTAAVSGEMRVEDVPVAPWADLAKIKAGDDDPMEVVVEVPAGKSKRGWNYRPEALQRIVGEVMSTGLPGFLGHQKAEDVSTQFLPPATHWVGAKWENGKAYFRGVIDKAAADLKRWIRAGVIRQVSIFGMPKLSRSATGEIDVVDYQPLSIDWTPLNRAGMPTSVVAVGEMDSTLGGIEPPNHGGGQTMNLQELLAQLRQQLQAKNTTMAAICGEMGWNFQNLAKEIGGEQYRALEARANAVGEMAELFGIGRDAQPEAVVSAAKAAREVQLQQARQAHEQLIDKVVGEMVVAEAARPLVKRMLRVDDNADEAAIRKAVGEMLEQEDVKTALSSLFSSAPVRGRHDNRASGSTDGLAVQRVSI
jgi:hypothetical protein